jgi:hypothetical protein
VRFSVTQDARFREQAGRVSEQQLLLAPVEPVLELELVDGAIADEAADAAVIAAPAGVAWRRGTCSGRPDRRPRGVSEHRRQYASIFRAFGDWLTSQP